MRIKPLCQALLLVALWCGGIAAGFAKGPAYRVHWYRAIVNHVDAHVTVLILTRGDKRYVRRLDLRLLGLPPGNGNPLLYESEIYYPAASLRGVKLYVDGRDRRIFFVDTSRPALAPPPSRDLLLTITVNGRRLDKPQYVQYADGGLLLPPATIGAMRIKPPATWNPPAKMPLPLSAVAGKYYSVDYRKLALDVTIPPRLLKTSTFSILQRTTRQPVAITPGRHGLSAIFDYDLARGHVSNDGYWSSGLYNLAFGGRTSACGIGYLDPPEEAAWRRLNTACHFDWPAEMTSVSVGDSISDGSTVTQPVRYGGLRIGTDFGLQPNFITLPDSRLSGTARVPSTLEVWVDQMLLLRSKVPAGPFDIEDIPLHTGAGELQATLISPTGAHQVVSSPFYIDSALLAPDLSAWSINFGKLREGFATGADQYTDGFAAANIRHGFTGAFTGELGFQTASDFRVVNAGAAVRLGSFAALDTAVAYSTGQGMHGSAVNARLTHVGRRFTVSYRWQHHSANYRELAYPEPGTAPKDARQLGLGFPIANGLSFNAADFRREYYDGTSVRFQSAALNVRLGNVGTLLLSAFHLSDGESPWMYAAQIIIPFGTRSNATAWSQIDGDTQRQRFGIQMNPPAGPGYGYRLQAGRDGSNRTALAALAMQSSLAQLDVEARRSGGVNSATARLSGSVLVSGDGIGLSRREPGSYAVVHVGAPDVPVYHDGQLRAYSDGSGNAIVGGLRPYDDNHITIRPEDVPLNVQPQSLEMTLVPGRREVMDVTFGFEPLAYLTGELRTAAGAFVPAGAAIHIAGLKKASVVGSQGRFFISTPAGGRLEVEATWDGHACRATVKLNAADNAKTVRDLGAITCREISR